MSWKWPGVCSGNKLYGVPAAGSGETAGGAANAWGITSALHTAGLFFLPPTARQRQGWGGRWNLNVPLDSPPCGRSLRQSWPPYPVPWLELLVPGAHSPVDVGVGHTAQAGPLIRLREHLPVSWWLGAVVSELAKGGPFEPKEACSATKASKAGWVTELVAAA